MASGFLLFAAACGGDDDSSPSSDAPRSSGSSDTAPTATAEEGAAESQPSSDSTGTDADTVGTITVGDESWMLVASVQCDFTSVPGSPITVVAIAGHAEGDESIEIAIDFDPRDIGLRLTVEGADGDPYWSAVNETFATRVGGPVIAGEGTFVDRSGSNGTAGSFDVRCQ